MKRMDDESTEDTETTPEESPDKTEGEAEQEKPENDTKNRRSDIAQKIKWREKAQAADTKVQTLETELAELKALVKKPTDDQEAKAQEYIRAQAREVYQELQRAKDSEERQNTEKFKSQIEDLLDENPDVSEEELLDTIEELDVDPATALKVLKRGGTKKGTEKPKLPRAGRASPDTKKDLPDDSNKSLYDIAREEIAKTRET